MTAEPKNTWIHGAFVTIKKDIGGGFLETLKMTLRRHEHVFGGWGWTLSEAERPRYKPFEEDGMLEEAWRADPDTGDYPVLRFGTKKPYYVDIMLLMQGDAGKIMDDRYLSSSVSIGIHRKYFENEKEVTQTQKVEAFLAFMNDLYASFQPLYGDMHEIYDNEAVRVSLAEKGIFSVRGLAKSLKFGRVKRPHLDCPVTGISWANYLGPGCVKFWGKERLLKAPGAVRKEKMPDGGMLLLTAPHPLTPDDPEHRANQLALWDYLGLKPRPNLKVIAQYKSPDPWKNAESVYEDW